MLKVQLIVVQGRPEGKAIPLGVPVFVVGRDAGCHLRPSSDQVSRRHAEFTITANSVIVKDLGSRNGTQLNGQTLTAPAQLKSGDLVKIGPLTFAVSIQGQPAAAQAAPVRPATSAPGSLDEVPQEQVESWLIADNERPVPDRPSGVYDGDTISIEAFKESQAAGGRPPSSREMPAAAPPGSKPAAAAPPTPAPAPAPAPKPTPEPRPAAPVAATPPPPKPAPAPAPAAASLPPATPAESGLNALFQDIVFEPLPEGEGDGGGGDAMNLTEGDEDETAGEDQEINPEEFFDPDNPFYSARKSGAAAETSEPQKAAYKDSSDAANDILKKMLERRRNR